MAEPTQHPTGGGRTQLSPKLIVAIVLGIVALVFVVQNTGETKIRFLLPEVKAPLWIALLAAAALGAIAGWLIGRRD